MENVGLISGRPGGFASGGADKKRQYQYRQRMIYAGTAGKSTRSGNMGMSETELDELARLRLENRRLAVTLGAFSAFIASKGMLEEAWHYVHDVHRIEEGEEM